MSKEFEMKADKFAPMVVGAIVAALAVYAVYKVAGVFVDMSTVLGGLTGGAL